MLLIVKQISKSQRFIICENFTLSEVEMPNLRHLRAFKTASHVHHSCRHFDCEARSRRNLLQNCAICHTPHKKFFPTILKKIVPLRQYL